MTALQPRRPTAIRALLESPLTVHDRRQSVNIYRQVRAAGVLAAKRDQGPNRSV